MKIGICTGGGDCPGLNAVIRAVVKHAVGNFGIEVIGIEDSFNGLMDRPLRVRTLGLAEVTGILDRGGTIIGTTNKGNPFHLQEKGKERDKSDLVIEGYKQLGLDGLIVVGGDGTQSIARQFLGHGLKIVGVPKTIDNDLAGTEQTIGFDTAVNIAADAVTRLQSTAEAHDRIMILEVMGRDAGHIALHAGIAGGANVILLPEIPFDYSAITQKVDERKALGRYFSLVVVAEGAAPKGGQQAYATQSSGVKTLGGIGHEVAFELEKRTGLETRVTVLGHIQRGGAPSPFDRVLATAFGVHAVDLLAKGKSGRLVVLKGNSVTDVDYASVADKSRPVDLHSSYLTAAESIGICLGRASSFDARRKVGRTHS